jgi:hypothetical protein
MNITPLPTPEQLKNKIILLSQWNIENHDAPNFNNHNNNNNNTTSTNNNENILHHLFFENSNARPTGPLHKNLLKFISLSLLGCQDYHETDPAINIVSFSEVELNALKDDENMSEATMDYNKSHIRYY